MSFEQFTTDTKTYDAVVRNLEIIGEASKNIPDAARAMMPKTPKPGKFLVRAVDDHGRSAVREIVTKIVE